MTRLKITNKPTSFFLKKNKKNIFNFINMNTLWWFNKSSKYQNKILHGENINFPDSFLISKKLKIKQKRGPEFINFFLNSPKIENKKNFIIGLNKEDFPLLLNKTLLSKKKVRFYDPSYIDNLSFPKDEINKILKLIKNFKPDYIWVAVGSPKQEILSNDLFIRYPCLYFNIGAGLNFLLKKKKPCPKLFRKIGLEWLYLLVTDFKRTGNKVWKSFLSLKYLNRGSIEKND